MTKLEVHQLQDPESSTYTYLLLDPATHEAVLIDTVKEQVKRDLAELKKHNAKLVYILDTHIHADHITGAWDLREATKAKTGVAASAKVDCADLALKEGDILKIGKCELRVIATPGHTNTCLSFYAEGMVFTGDALFIGDAGRTDFQDGSPENLYASVAGKLFSLPDATVVFPGHDYNGKKSSSIAQEKAQNIKFGGGKTKSEAVKLLREMKLAPPKKIHIAVPANLRCGKS